LDYTYIEKIGKLGKRAQKGERPKRYTLEGKIETRYSLLNTTVKKK